LNVPARTPFSPWRWPAWFALFGHLPQHEVPWVTLHVNHVNARASLQLVKILTGKRAVGRIGWHGEHHVAIVRNVRVAAFNQLFRDLDNFVNMVGRTRLAVRAENV